MSTPVSLHIPDAQKMVDLGKTLGRRIFAGAIIALKGPMGAGKTTFVRGVAAGMELEEGFVVSSPTYTILQSYPCREMDLFHLDLYRITGRDDLDSTGYRDAIHGENVLVIEWIDREPQAVPEENLLISLEYCDEGRRVTFHPSGQVYEQLVKDVIAGFTGS